MILKSFTSKFEELLTKGFKKLTWTSFLIPTFYNYALTYMRTVKTYLSYIKESDYIISLELSKIRKYDLFNITTQIMPLPIKVSNSSIFVYVLNESNSI
jgi:hypothetical protein